MNQYSQRARASRILDQSKRNKDRLRGHSTLATSSPSSNDVLAFLHDDLNSSQMIPQPEEQPHFQNFHYIPDKNIINLLSQRQQLSEIRNIIEPKFNDDSEIGQLQSSKSSSFSKFSIGSTEIRNKIYAFDIFNRPKDMIDEDEEIQLIEVPLQCYTNGNKHVNELQQLLLSGNNWSSLSQPLEQSLTEIQLKNGIHSGQMYDSKQSFKEDLLRKSGSSRNKAGFSSHNISSEQHLDSGKIIKQVQSEWIENSNPTNALESKQIFESKPPAHNKYFNQNQIIGEEMYIPKHIQGQEQFEIIVMSQDDSENQQMEDYKQVSLPFLPSHPQQIQYLNSTQPTLSNKNKKKGINVISKLISQSFNSSESSQESYKNFFNSSPQKNKTSPKFNQPIKKPLKNTRNQFFNQNKPSKQISCSCKNCSCVAMSCKCVSSRIYCSENCYCVNCKNMEPEFISHQQNEQNFEEESAEVRSANFEQVNFQFN